jgi:hypothetical protein
MSRRKAAYGAVVSLLLAVTVFACQGGMDGVLGQVARELQASQGLGQSDIVAGLKEALRVGTENAVDVTSKFNGYYSNPEIKIPLPENLRKVDNVLRMAGMGQQVTSFEQSMNRAAERAAPEAKALFVGAIKQMTFADAKKILNGRENEATLFFKDKTYHALGQRFEPLVHNAMAEVGVTRSYQTLEDKIRVLPVKGLMDFNLDQYVTDKALDGLFVMLAQEEAKIRTDPAARVTDILKKVFGSQQ